MAAGMASRIASIHMTRAVKRVTGFAESRPATWRRIGFTMAQYLSALRAVSVNTDTPIDTSFANSDTLQMSSPYGHDSSCNNYVSIECHHCIQICYGTVACTVIKISVEFNNQLASLHSYILQIRSVYSNENSYNSYINMYPSDGITVLKQFTVQLKVHPRLQL